MRVLVDRRGTSVALLGGCSFVMLGQIDSARADQRDRTHPPRGSSAGLSLLGSRVVVRFRSVDRHPDGPGGPLAALGGVATRTSARFASTISRPFPKPTRASPRPTVDVRRRYRASTSIPEQAWEAQAREMHDRSTGRGPHLRATSRAWSSPSRPLRRSSRTTTVRPSSSRGPSCGRFARAMMDGQGTLRTLSPSELSIRRRSRRCSSRPLTATEVGPVRRGGRTVHPRHRWGLRIHAPTSDAAASTSITPNTTGR